MGEAARERHHIVMSFLEHIGVPTDVAALDAEGIEHHVSSIALERMAHFMAQYPRIEP